MSSERERIALIFALPVHTACHRCWKLPNLLASKCQLGQRFDALVSGHARFSPLSDTYGPRGDADIGTKKAIRSHYGFANWRIHVGRARQIPLRDCCLAGTVACSCQSTVGVLSPASGRDNCGGSDVVPDLFGNLSNCLSHLNGANLGNKQQQEDRAKEHKENIGKLLSLPKACRCKTYRTVDGRSTTKPRTAAWTETATVVRRSWSRPSCFGNCVVASTLHGNENTNDI